MDYIKNETTAILADDILSAAQELERAARQLKVKAKCLRASGVFAPAAGADYDAVALQRMHAHYDVVAAAALAYDVLHYER
jgi:hypothetical protein